MDFVSLGMAKFLLTNVALEERKTVSEENLFGQERKHEKVMLSIELIGSGDTTGIFSEELLHIVMERLKEIEKP